MRVKNNDELTADLDIDSPEKIIGSKQDNNKKLYCLVEWKIRSDGSKPENLYIETSWFKTKYSKMLIEYYESKIKFIS